MAKHDWSTEEIRLAKEHFLAGLTIKDIAKKLGRTPSSTNKALTRFGIRVKSRQCQLLAQSSMLKKEADKNNSSFLFKTPGFDRKSLNHQLDNWVSFWKVCDYLSAQKINIFEKSDYSIPLTQRKFQVGRKIYSARQLLLVANKIRAEQHLPTFFVEGLSW